MTTIDDTEILARRIPLEGTLNVRDIGGYVTHDGRVVARRKVLRGDAVHMVDDQGRELLTQLPLRTSIDLRELDERTSAPDRLNADAQLISIPLFTYRQDDDELVDRAQFSTLDDVYRFLVSQRGPAVAEVLRQLAQPATMPALVHCTGGKDRTGVVIALLLSLLGVPDDVIARDYEATSLFLTPAFHEAILARAEAAGQDRESFVAMLGCESYLIYGVLSTVRATHGDVESYLVAHGLSTEEVGRLREMLLEDGDGEPAHSVSGSSLETEGGSDV
jgi:protein-tyrosine phosphatase